MIQQVPYLEERSAHVSYKVGTMILIKQASWSGRSLQIDGNFVIQKVYHFVSVVQAFHASFFQKLPVN